MARHRRRQRNARSPNWAVFAIAVSLSASLGLLVGKSAHGRLQQAAVPAAPVRHSALPLVPQLNEPTNVLFMACDNTDAYESHGREVIGMRANTDTMMVARLDPARQQVRLLSIPRDTRVPIPGHGTFKINAANPYGGPELAMQVVSDFLGVPVQKYLLIDTRAVVQLVDAVGGVTLFVPKDLNYDDETGHLHIHLTKGWHHLGGQQAHDFLRFRHDDGGDIGRVQRQQSFLDAFFRQCLTPRIVLAAPRLLALAHQDVATNLSPLELLRMANWGKGLTSQDVQLSMVPGHEAIIARGWYWVADPASTAALVHTFLDQDEAPLAQAPDRARVAVLDGVGDEKALVALHRVLRHDGYLRVEDDGPAPEAGQARTRIIAERADVPGAQALARTLGVGEVEVDATGNVDSDFTIVMGQDWVQAQSEQRSEH
ncbi:MAG TPA: LCP family protein [Oscillatoriaceae cyanobacterium]